LPLINPSSYSCPFWLRNPHAATIIPSIVRKIELPSYTRERINTPDDDFLDLDRQQTGNSNLIIISHGLEGGSSRTYVKGLAALARQSGWDTLAWNCRSCSGEMNNKPRFYHHGDSDDLATVINHVNYAYQYSNILLVGYSMGGSMIAKYLGEGSYQIPTEIIGGVAISTPFDLKGSAVILDGPGMAFYRKRFLKKLGNKVLLKSKIWPDIFDPEGFDQIKTFLQFDNRYTAPLHGFEDAYDFYIKSSAGQHLAGINMPFLIMNAQDDPFLTNECYPINLAKEKSNIYLDMPEKGGHVGFMTGKNKPTWSEIRVFQFIEECIKKEVTRE
jgi:predicted alpha/beta-fold hydrolase